MEQYEITNKGDGVYEMQKPSSSIRYYVNENKKTVVAKMFDVNEEIESDMFRFMDKHGMMFLTYCDFYDKLINSIKPTLCGKSRCIGEDEFDVEVGIEKARNHLLEKYYRDYSDLIVKMLAELYCFRKDCENKLDKLEEKRLDFNDKNLEDYLAVKHYLSKF